jgi:hypothetical protein
MDYSDRQVIVNASTNSERFPYRKHNQVKLFGSIDLTDESAVKRLFGEADIPDRLSNVR